MALTLPAHAEGEYPPDTVLETIMGAVEFMRLILLENPLSGPSADDAQQTVCSSPVDRAVSCSPASETAQSSLPAEGKPLPVTTPTRLAGDAIINGSANSAASRSPPAASTPVQAAVSNPKAEYDIMRALPEQPGFLEGCISEAVAGLDMSEYVVWPRPSPATWRQICTIAVRALCALKHVLLCGASMGGERSTVQIQDVQDGLMRLLYELLMGHLADDQLDLSDVVQQGAEVMVFLWESDSQRPCFLGVMTRLMLHRLLQDVLRARLKQTKPTPEQNLHIFSMLSKATGSPANA